MKYKGIEVIETPWYLKLNPQYWFFVASAEYPKIVLRKDLFTNLFSKNPDPDILAIVEHEITHIRRQEKMGWIKFRIKYSLFPKFRLQEELEGDRARFKYLKKKGLKFDFKARAKQLSSWGYFWMISETDVLRSLKRIWYES